MSFLGRWFKPEKLENELNRKSAAEFGWGPAWFDNSGFNESLTNKVKRFQRKSGINPTGIVDLETYEKKLEELQNPTEEIKNYIIAGKEKIPINWDKVITFDSREGLELPESHYRKVINYRNPRMFVVHWDATLSSKTTYKILMKRGISVHFGIDNDGTIHQWMDAEDIGWHAGNRIVNNRSIGVEISNAYYLKYQNHYETSGFGPRPIWKNIEVHGQILDPFLGFYDIQLRALKELIRACNLAYPRIKLDIPKDRNGELSKTVVPSVKRGRFQGVVNHYNVTKRKIDSAGCPLDKIVEQIKNEQD